MIFLRAILIAVMGILLLNAGVDAKQQPRMQNYEAYDQSSPAPKITFQDENGRSRTLAEFKGKVVLLNIWATWCAPCRTEMASLNKVQASFPEDKFEVVAIASERKGTDKVLNFFKENNLDQLTPYFDLTAQIPRLMNIQGIPQTYIIDADGRVRGNLRGAAEWDSSAAKELIQFYLDEKNPVPSTSS